MVNGPVFEAIPKHALPLDAGKRREFVSAPCGNEIDGVVAIPMLEAMLTVEMLVIAMRTLLHAEKDSDRSPFPRPSRRAHFSEPVIPMD